jgi:Na+/H+-dicarboxylate symporter
MVEFTIGIIIGFLLGLYWPDIKGKL